MSLQGRQLKILKEGEEKWGKLTGGVVSHDMDSIIEVLVCIPWAVVS